MMHPAEERLSDLLDDTLADDERAALQAHLDSCAECAALLDELRRVVSRARALEDRSPRHDLWPGVAAAIGASLPVRRRFAFSLPQLLAAGIALMVMSGGTVALALRARAPRPATAAVGSPAALPSGEVTAAATTPAEHGYDAAVRELSQELAAGHGRLDSTTVRVVQQKLQLIDRAIAEAERALAADPGNSYLHGHLTQTRMRKLELLRRAARLARS
jgi:anti-sigma factor RsiW